MAIFTKLVATLLRTAQVLGSLYAVGVCTYFIVELAKRNAWTGRTLAVEIISGAGFLWATFCLLLTVCLLQKSFFQFFTIIGDLLFVGGFIAVVVLIRNAWGSNCSANNTAVPWLERGGPNLNVNCQLVKGLFIVAIVLAGLFFLTTLIAFLAHRSTKKDKAYGPSPSNNYTSGRGKKNHHKDDTEAHPMGTTLAPPAPIVAGRRSHDSKYTDATEKTTSDGLLHHPHPATTNTNGTTAGREYLAPRAGYAPTDRTVSPVPSTTNLHNTHNTHAGQYAMAGALVGGAGAAAHHNKHDNYSNQNDTLPPHPGPTDGTRDHVYTTPQAHERIAAYTGHHPHFDGAQYNNQNTNSTYSELDNTTTTGQSYDTPAGYANTNTNSSVRQPNTYYPAASELDSQNLGNPHYYSTELDGKYDEYNPQELGGSPKRYSQYQSPVEGNNPFSDRRTNEEEAYGYGSGPGRTGGPSNQVSALPELGREDQKRF